MIDGLQFLLPAFLVAVCLVGIHAYFGIMVLVRKVIFVDLALAQIAALGATVAFMVESLTFAAHWRMQRV